VNAQKAVIADDACFVKHQPKAAMAQKDPASDLGLARQSGSENDPDRDF
jgi:hypothetical protein